jgi:hypothetical protein
LRTGAFLLLLRRSTIGGRARTVETDPDIAGDRQRQPAARAVTVLTGLGDTIGGEIIRRGPDFHITFVAIRSLPIPINDLVPQRIADCLGPIVETKLVQDIPDVELHRVLAQVQMSGQLPV